jgi:hypothetical protein
LEILLQTARQPGENHRRASLWGTEIPSFNRLVGKTVRARLPRSNDESARKEPKKGTFIVFPPRA